MTFDTFQPNEVTTLSLLLLFLLPLLLLLLLSLLLLLRALLLLVPFPFLLLLPPLLPRPSSMANGLTGHGRV